MPQKRQSSYIPLAHFRALKRELPRLKANGVRLRIIGDRTAFGDRLQQRMADTEAATAGGDRLVLQVAANYGGRWDITQAARSLARAVAAGELEADAIDESRLAAELSFPDVGDPDLLIRTGGEQRLSNFLLWQSAYAELYFTDTLWPDFDAAAYGQVLQAFVGRQRRFGLTAEQVEGPPVAEVRSALKFRLLTALALIPPAVAAVLFLPTPWLAALLGLVVGLGALEWARLGGLSSGVPSWLLVAYQLPLLWLVHALSAYPGLILLALGLCAGWWLGVGITLALRRTLVAVDRRMRPVLLIGAPLLTALAWVSVVRLHAVPDLGPRLVLSLLVLIWVADSAAYFAGRALGRRKLSPMVSPGKTLEGLAGALAGAGTFGLLLVALDLLGGVVRRRRRRPVRRGR